MKVSETLIPGVLRITSDRFGDRRGHFEEIWHSKKFADLGLQKSFVQVNHNRSATNVLRGFHFQKRRPQAKLVAVLRGRVFDVAVDLRQDSDCYAQWHGEELGDNAPTMLYIPEGCAHGFCTMEGPADLLYMCTAPYDPNDDCSLAWNDPQIGVDWPLNGAEPILSDRDASAPTLSAMRPICE